MNACDKCNYLMERHRIESPAEYFAILDDMRKLIDRGGFELVMQTCGFEEIMKDNVWYSDDIQHVIKCRKCKKEFVCACDTYHGFGMFYIKD